MKWPGRIPAAVDAAIAEAPEPEPRVGLAGIAAPGSPRRVLYEAEQLRARAERAAEWVNLARPGINLHPAITAGTLRLDDAETLTVARDALTAAAERWTREADDLEATVVVTP